MTNEETRREILEQLYRADAFLGRDFVQLFQVKLVKLVPGRDFDVLLDVRKALWELRPLTTVEIIDAIDDCFSHLDRNVSGVLEFFRELPSRRAEDDFDEETALAEANTLLSETKSDFAARVRNVARKLERSAPNGVHGADRPKSPAGTSLEVDTSSTQRNSVFVVHGRDDSATHALKTWLRAIGLAVIGWEDARAAAASGSPSNFDIVRAGVESAGVVVILFTPDESSRVSEHLCESPSDATLRTQPRPNVIFEAGWALGAHRQKTLIVESRTTHDISDIDGFNTVRMRNAGSLNDLASRLRALGCVINLNDPAWMEATRYPGLFPPSKALT